MINKAYEFAQIIEEKREEIINLFLNFESYETIIYEIEKSIGVLRSIEKEQKYFKGADVDTISVFLPINLPLYSLVIYCIIPSFIARKIFVHTSVFMRENFVKLAIVLDLKRFFPNLAFPCLDRKLFVLGYASVSDVVVFNGLYKNVINIIRDCPNAFIIYNGAGINPSLICTNADIKMATKKILQARFFNSGQDCAAPDAVLVHSSVYEKFEIELEEEISHFEVGSYRDRSVKIGRLVNRAQLDIAKKFFSENKEDIILGGEIDFNQAVVYPTVLRSSLRLRRNFMEFFSPIVYVSIFETDSELDGYFQSRDYLDFAMYVSIYGKTSYENRIKESILLYDKNVLELGDAGEGFGGYGMKANFSYYHGKYNCHPILISKEIKDWYLNKGKKRTLYYPTLRPSKKRYPPIKKIC